MERVDYGFMGETGHWRWSRIRFNSGYEDTTLHTPDHEPRRDVGTDNERPNNTVLDVTSKTSTRELENYSVGHHAPRGEVWQKLPKTHVWKYSGRPSKDNIDALAQLIGSHLQHGKGSQTVSLDSNSYSDHGTLDQRIRERLDVPQFQQCGHKCQRGRLTHANHIIRVCCRCVATSLWFGVQSRLYSKAECTLAEAECVPAFQLSPSIRPLDRRYELSFKNGIVVPTAPEF